MSLNYLAILLSIPQSCGHQLAPQMAKVPIFPPGQHALDRRTPSILPHNCESTSCRSTPCPCRNPPWRGCNPSNPPWRGCNPSQPRISERRSSRNATSFSTSFLEVGSVIRGCISAALSDVNLTNPLSIFHVSELKGTLWCRGGLLPSTYEVIHPS